MYAFPPQITNFLTASGYFALCTHAVFAPSLQPRSEYSENPKAYKLNSEKAIILYKKDLNVLVVNTCMEIER